VKGKWKKKEHEDQFSKNILKNKIKIKIKLKKRPKKEESQPVWNSETHYHGHKTGTDCIESKPKKIYVTKILSDENEKKNLSELELTY
jgi:hypothetical protein